jgi:hypothetical protein
VNLAVWCPVRHLEQASHAPRSCVLYRRWLEVGDGALNSDLNPPWGGPLNPLSTLRRERVGTRLFGVAGPCRARDLILVLLERLKLPNPRRTQTPLTVAPYLIVRERRRASRLPFGAART